MYPILLITFNRPDFVVRLIDIIKQISPKELYIYSDAPRTGNAEDEANVFNIRKIVDDLKLFNCEIHYNFEVENKGCKYGPISAISWFFNNVDAGIILEDDCMPSPLFFKYAGFYLDLYRTNEKVYSISGTNICPPKLTLGTPYSSIYHIPWGWATWKRAWILFDYECNFLMSREFNSKFSQQGFLFKNGWSKNINSIMDGTHHMWDPQWNLFCFYRSAVSIYPPINLIKNIGHDSRATHTKNAASKFSLLDLEDYQFELSNNVNIIDTKKFDDYIGRRWWSMNLFEYFKDRIKSLIGH